MTLIYLHYTITKIKHPETGEDIYELAHWYIPEKLPHIAGKLIIDYYKSYEEAENEHHRQALIDKFYPDEIGG